jgi:hypothetical protein
MDVSEVYLELYGRITYVAGLAADGLTPEQLLRQPGPDTNPIGWLLWHAARVQDHHVAELLETDQIWQHGDWAARFGLTPEPQNIGYGHKPDDVAAVQPESAQLCLDYLTTVQERTVSQLLTSVTPDQLARIVDRRWDPPVTMGVRLVSVADDSLQHTGQARYLRGLFGW